MVVQLREQQGAKGDFMSTAEELWDRNRDSTISNFLKLLHNTTKFCHAGRSQSSRHNHFRSSLFSSTPPFNRTSSNAQRSAISSAASAILFTFVRISNMDSFPKVFLAQMQVSRAPQQRLNRDDAFPTDQTYQLVLSSEVQISYFEQLVSPLLPNFIMMTRIDVNTLGAHRWGKLFTDTELKVRLSPFKPADSSPDTTNRIRYLICTEYRYHSFIWAMSYILQPLIMNASTIG